MAEPGDPSDARPDERLLLLAQEADEVPLISALVQDAAVRACDIGWDARGRRLVLLLNRYRWEANDQTRVRSALRLEGVLRVQRRGWTDVNTRDPGVTVLELLAFTMVEGAVVLDFAAGPSIRVEVECVDVVLEDISGPWSAGREPKHR